MEIRNLLLTRALAAACLTGAAIAGSIPDNTPQGRVLNNFQQVDSSLYRGAQPSKEGFRELAKMGVRTIIDLRGGEARSDNEAGIVRGLGMQYIHMPLAGYQAPTPEEVKKLLSLLEDPKIGPVFVHCRRGADRTGTILACYRIDHDHWGNQQALDEAMKMKMANRERLMREYVLHFTPSQS